MFINTNLYFMSFVGSCFILHAHVRIVIYQGKINSLTSHDHAVMSRETTHVLTVSEFIQLKDFYIIMYAYAESHETTN